MGEEVLNVIFLYLHKAYKALDRDILMEILEGYGVGPQAHLIPRVYWDRLRMVVRVGGYYGTEFQGFRGVMQVGHLSSTIVNGQEPHCMTPTGLTMV